jgi:hypothetical protein
MISLDAPQRSVSREETHRGEAFRAGAVAAMAWVKRRKSAGVSSAVPPAEPSPAVCVKTDRLDSQIEAFEDYDSAPLT